MCRNGFLCEKRNLIRYTHQFFCAGGGGGGGGGGVNTLLTGDALKLEHGSDILFSRYSVTSRTR